MADGPDTQASPIIGKDMVIYAEPREELNGITCTVRAYDGTRKVYTVDLHSLPEGEWWTGLPLRGWVLDAAALVRADWLGHYRAVLGELHATRRHRGETTTVTNEELDSVLALVRKAYPV